MTANVPRYNIPRYNVPCYDRRQWLAATAAAALCATSRRSHAAPADEKPKFARIAITLDLEMCRNFPTWERTHWDYEKGNLDDDTKAYALEAARRVKEHGGRIHFFLVGRVLEQENVDWLKELAAQGHSIGNHTYDHVNVLATQRDQIQFRFQRAPWLIEGQSPAEVIAENVRRTDLAARQRLSLRLAGFRTPGGFATGLREREDVQRMLLEQGYRWVSSLYPAHPVGTVGQAPGDDVLEAIVAAQQAAQPFLYPSGLVEVPMSPISDIGAFRNGRWPLASFREAVRRGVQWAIDQRAVYDFLAHPACLLATDPEFTTIEMICRQVEAAGDAARLVDLNEIAAEYAGKS